MEAWLTSVYADLHWSQLAAIIAAALFVIGKAADWLVDEAVELSERSQIPKAVIGATIVSLGTTMPEAAVSVFAAMEGSPGLALGNAVGSVICDTGLILGLACVIAPLRLDRKVVNRQGWIQLASGVLLILACVPWANPTSALTAGGVLPQWLGFVFLALLALYLYQSIAWAKQERAGAVTRSHETSDATWLIILKLVGAVALVVASARVLIPAIEEAALRMEIPESIIAATLVAFGTSLPELVTAVTAARKGQGELAVGNVVGADILNVLFVAGAAAAVTPQGLVAGPQFFSVLFPVMIFVLLVFRFGIMISGDWLKKPFGFTLLAAYGIYTVVIYLFQGGAAGH